MTPAKDYPPETAKHLSWAALQFITRPSPRFLAWSAGGLMTLLGLAAASLPALHVDLRVPAQGVVAADPSVIPAVAPEDGNVDAWLAPPGAQLKRGQPIALLQLGAGGDRIPRISRALNENASLLAELDSRQAMPQGVETGALLEDFPDPAVRDRANALEAAFHKLDEALEHHLEYATARDEFLNANRRLRGALVEYLERHQVRAPASGLLLQFEQPLHATVPRGQPIAAILPREARLVAKLTVEPRSSAELAVGQRVTHRLEAYPYQEYGVFGGRILRIEQASDPQKGVIYIVHASIELPRRLPARLAARVRLMRGMRCDSSIVTGRKRLFDLALESLFGKR